MSAVKDKEHLFFSSKMSSRACFAKTPQVAGTAIGIYNAFCYCLYCSLLLRWHYYCCVHSPKDDENVVVNCEPKEPPRRLCTDLIVMPSRQKCVISVNKWQSSPAMLYLTISARKKEKQLCVFTVCTGTHC